jgi:MFS family permease
MVGATLGSLLTGRLFARLTHYLRVPIVGLVISIATLGFLAFDAGGLSLGAFSWVLGLLGLAVGPMYPTSTIVMQNTVKLHHLGTGTGALNFFRLLGGAIIVAVFGAIVLGSTGDHAGVVTPETLAAGHADFAAAFRLVFIAAGIFLAISLLCLIALEERPLQGPVRLADRAE